MASQDFKSDGLVQNITHLQDGVLVTNHFPYKRL